MLNKVTLVILMPLTLAACQSTSEPARVMYPVEKCGYVNEPIYGILDRPASEGEVVGGAVIGGLIGNQFGDGDGKAAMTVLGAIAGGSIASERKQESVVVGHKKVYKCYTEYK